MLFRRRLKASNDDIGDEDSTNSYLRQRQALSKNITRLRIPQRLYIPGSEPLLDAIDPVLVADHPENVELWLPSALPPASRDAQCNDGLPQLEYRLRCAQAANALHDIRYSRRLMRVLLVKTRSHISNTQRTMTRARGLFDKVKTKLAQAVTTYRTARKAIEKLAPNEEFGKWKDSLLELRKGDIRGPGPEEGESASRFVQSWIWTTASRLSSSAEDPDLQAALRAEWCKTQERAKRYEEEIELVMEEMRQTLVTFEWNALEWESFATSPPIGDSAIDNTTVAGIAAYARKQADVQRKMAKIFLNHWYPLLEQPSLKPNWLKKYPRPPENKHRRLISNVTLYHSDSHNSCANSFDAEEEEVDNFDSYPDSMIHDDFEDY